MDIKVFLQQQQEAGKLYNPSKQTLNMYINHAVANMNTRRLNLNFSEDCTYPQSKTQDKVLKKMISQDTELNHHFANAPARFLNGERYELMMTDQTYPIQIKTSDSSFVLLGVDKEDNSFVAVKIYQKGKRIDEQRILVEFMLQEKAHVILNGGFVCRAPRPIGFLRLKKKRDFEDIVPLLTVMEWCNFVPNHYIGLSLYDAVQHDKDKVTDKERLVNKRDYATICMSLINAVNAMQRNQVFHLDIKEENVMLKHIEEDEDTKVVPILTDFSVSVSEKRRGWLPFGKRLKDNTNLAPELFEKN